MAQPGARDSKDSARRRTSLAGSSSCRKLLESPCCYLHATEVFLVGIEVWMAALLETPGFSQTFVTSGFSQTDASGFFFSSPF